MGAAGTVGTTGVAGTVETTGVDGVVATRALRFTKDAFFPLKTGFCRR